MLNDEVLDCYKANLFLVKPDGSIVTPIFNHPMSAPFTVIPTYSRDSILVISTQKLSFSTSELSISLSSLSSYSEAFLAHDLLGILPVSSISTSSSLFSFPKTSQSSRISTELDSILQGKTPMKTLCMDNYTEEDWSIIL
jgi:branched-subunit amino acid aminotransferase/4-amino-4-deoxychorismate lyase